MRVLLVDDHALFSQSLAIVLSDFPSVEQFSNVKSIDEIGPIIERDKPDILLMDINLGKLAEEDGLLLAQSLLQKYPNQKIVVLSGYDLPVYRKEAEKLGAKGFINKDIEPEELLHILERINNGSTYFEKDETYIEELTETEKQVLRMLASSMKRKEIAEHLFIRRLRKYNTTYTYDFYDVGTYLDCSVGCYFGVVGSSKPIYWSATTQRCV